MKRRRKGTGSIDRLDDGRFQGRLPDDVRTRLEPRPTYEEAARDLDACIAEIADGGSVLPGGQTLRAWGIEVLDELELAGVDGVHKERSRFNSQIVDSDFIDWPIPSISPGAIHRWLKKVVKRRVKRGFGHKKRRRKKIGRGTAQNALNLLRTILQAAVEAEIIEVNPAVGIRLPRTRKGVTHEPWTYLMPHEQTALLAGELDELHDLITYAMRTGVRQGEQWNQRLADVHEDHVIVRFGSKGKPRKNGRILRVPLFGEAREAVSRQKARLKGRPNPYGLLWPTPRGARRGSGKAPKGWKERLLAAGIIAKARHDGQRVRWHDLRHTLATSLRSGWWGREWLLEEIQQMLGHKSIKTTERYAHLVDSAVDEAVRETDTHKPKMSPTRKESDLVTVENHSAPPARIGLATFGLGRRSESELIQEVERLSGLVLGLSEMAQAALVAVAKDEPGAMTKAIETLDALAAAGDAERAAQRALARSS